MILEMLLDGIKICKLDKRQLANSVINGRSAAIWENQKNKIVQWMKEIREDIINYDIYQDFLDDQELK